MDEEEERKKEIKKKHEEAKKKEKNLPLVAAPVLSATTIHAASSVNILPDNAISNDETLYTSVGNFFAMDLSDTVVSTPPPQYKLTPVTNEIMVPVMKEFETDSTPDCDHELNEKISDPVNDSSPKTYSAPEANISKTSPVPGPDHTAD